MGLLRCIGNSATHWDKALNLRSESPNALKFYLSINRRMLTFINKPIPMAVVNTDDPP
mgnify:CR=1 FL=1